MKSYITEILVFLGGIISGLFGYRQFTKTEKRNEMEIVIDTYKELANKMIESDERCKAELAKLRDEVGRLKNQMLILENSSNDLPFPQWLKDMELKMVWMNKEYEKAFLIPRGLRASDYIGKTDEEIWGEEAGQSFRKNDLLVMHSKTGYWYGEEKIEIKEVNVSSHWKIVKYVRYSGNIPTNIGGMAIPI